MNSYKEEIQSLNEEIQRIKENSLYWVQLAYNVDTKEEAIEFICEEIEHLKNLIWDIEAIREAEEILETERMLDLSIY